MPDAKQFWIRLASYTGVIDEIIRLGVLEGFLGLPKRSLVDKGTVARAMPKIEAASAETGREVPEWILEPGRTGLEGSLRKFLVINASPYFDGLTTRNLELQIPDFNWFGIVDKNYAKNKTLAQYIGDKSITKGLTLAAVQNSLGRFIQKAPGVVSKEWLIRKAQASGHIKKRRQLSLSAPMKPGEEKFSLENLLQGRPGQLTDLEILRKPEVQAGLRQELSKLRAKGRKKDILLAEMIERVFLDGDTITEARKKVMEEYGVKDQQVSGAASKGRILEFFKKPAVRRALRDAMDEVYMSESLGYSRLAKLKRLRRKMRRSSRP